MSYYISVALLFLAGYIGVMGLRVTAPAGEINPPSERFCTCCEKPLKGIVAWLELDQRTNTYHDLGGIPPERSQGWFAFGTTCAKKLLKAHETKVAQ